MRPCVSNDVRSTPLIIYSSFSPPPIPPSFRSPPPSFPLEPFAAGWRFARLHMPILGSVAPKGEGSAQEKRGEKKENECTKDEPERDARPGRVVRERVVELLRGFAERGELAPCD